MKINRIYYFCVLFCCLISPFILFTAHHQYCYLSGDYSEKIMRVKKLTRDPSSSKRISTTIFGTIKNQEVSFGLQDDDAYNFMSYLKEDKKEIAVNYDNLKPLELDVRVVQFGSSNNVLFIKKEETKEEATKRNLIFWIMIEVFSFGALLIFYILKKNYEKKN
jgi:hypothetical protein